MLITKASAIAETLVARPTGNSSRRALVSASGIDAMMHGSILLELNVTLVLIIYSENLTDGCLE